MPKRDGRPYCLAIAELVPYGLAASPPLTGRLPMAPCSPMAASSDMGGGSCAATSTSSRDCTAEPPPGEGWGQGSAEALH